MADLLVDFGDPESVASAIPRAKKLMQRAEQRAAAARNEAEQARERASDAEIEIQRLRAVLLTLEQFGAETTSAPTDDAEKGNSQNRALKVVIAINGPTDIAEVAEHMPDFSRKTVSWALWKLADEGVIQRLGHGRYASQGYVPGQPTTNYLKLPPGFPRPSQTQIEHAAEMARAAAKGRTEG